MPKVTGATFAMTNHTVLKHLEQIIAMEHGADGVESFNGHRFAAQLLYLGMADPMGLMTLNPKQESKE